MFSCFNFSAYVIFFVNVLIEMNVNICNLIEMNVNISNELNFSDVYRSVNYTSKVYMHPSGFIHFARDPT